MTTLVDRLRTALAERFLVEQELGRGGMATVFRAHDPKHNRDVALKVLHPELASAIGAERFFREIQIAARLNHPHILPLLDSGQADGLFYYVMPLLSGETLRDRLERERQLPVADALRIATQMAAALSHAHRHGVIHRDIKPENVLLHEGEVQVADFGIAFAVSGAGERLTETGLSIGTPQYMSPEQATGERQLDARSDLYSLGCVVYEMLAGEPPITGVTTQAIIAKLMTERPVRLRTIRDGVPVAVDEAVAQVLAKVPADRFATAEEFAAALSAPAAVHRKPWNGKRLAVAGLVTLGVVGLAGLGRLLTGRSRASPTPAAPRLEQITFTGDAEEVALSPDGKSIAYLADTIASLVVQDLGGGGRVKLIRDSTLKALRWSPDGTRLLYGTGRQNCFCSAEDSRLYLLPRLGGERVDLSPPEATPISSPWSFDFGGNDSTVLVGFTTAGGKNKWIYLGGDPATIRRINDDSVTARGRVLRLAGPLDGDDPGLGRLRLSPNGRWIAFSAGYPDLVGTISVNGGGRNILLEDSAAIGAGYGLEWAPAGDALYLQRIEGAVGAILRLGVDPRTGAARGRAEPILSNLAAPSTLGLSADGRRLALVSGLDRIHLLLVRLGTPGGADPVTTPISCGTASCRWGMLSPDGRFLAYLQSANSAGDVNPDLYLRPIGGGPERRLATAVALGASPSWSPDGRQIAYLRYAGDSSALLVVDVATARSHVAWRGPLINSWGESWAADGHRLAFGSARGLVVLTDTVERLVSRDTTHIMTWPVFSPDGRQVVVRHSGPDGMGLWLVDLASGAEARLLTGSHMYPVAWREDGNIYFVQGDSSLQAVTLEAVRATGGAVRVVGVFPRSGYTRECYVNSISPTTDLRTTICLEGQRNSDIWVVDNFDQGHR